MRAESMSVILPAYNEERNIGPMVRSALEILPTIVSDYEIIVVNDGSSDRSAEVIQALCQEHSCVRTVTHERNRGYGAALKSGIQAARMDLIFFTDCDLQFDLRELPELLQWVGDFDVAAGYRVARKDPFHRKVNAFGWNVLVRMVFGLKIRDIDCAFKVFRRHVFDQIQIESVGAMVNTEILAQCQRLGLSIKEVPVNHFPRKHGEQSGANPRVVIKAFVELIKLHGKLKRMSDETEAVGR